MFVLHTFLEIKSVKKTISQNSFLIWTNLFTCSVTFFELHTRLCLIFWYSSIRHVFNICLQRLFGAFSVRIVYGTAFSQI